MYEHASYDQKEILYRNLCSEKFLPTIKYTWNISLRNGKVVRAPVKDHDLATWTFSLMYAVHDLGLNEIEFHLHNFYPLEYCYFDIGANLGIRSLLMMTENRRVILFEPNSVLNETTNELINLNNFSRSSVENLALSDFTGTSEFYFSRSTYLSSFNQDYSEKEGSSTSAKVSVTTLDHYYESRGLSCVPKIIKIDVERHELNVLKGASQVIQKFLPALIIEIFPEDPDKLNIFDFIMQYRYVVFAIENNSEKPLTKMDSRDHFRVSASVNFLFVHDHECVEYLSGKNLINS
jgi:FkbM family methyltransferase